MANNYPSSTGNDFNIFEVFFDLPHPATISNNVPPNIVEPLKTDYRRKDINVKELFTASKLDKIARFAFPEFDDRRNEDKLVNKKRNGGYQYLNQYDIYFHSFQSHHFTFSIRLSNDANLNGHVRRYFPCHEDAPSRYDVGRRCPRAMVILTLAPGGERFYSSILKTIEAITMHENATKVFQETTRQRRVENFLHDMQKQYEALCKDHDFVKDNFRERNGQNKFDVDSFPSFIFERKNFTKIAVEGIEYSEDSPLLSIDKVQFILPESLQPDYTGLYTAEDINCPMIPLMRALGATNVLRLLSALLCERRIVMVSRCPTRLSACMRGAVSMLAQGLVNWQHLFVPILPPHLIKYITVDSPYLIGVLFSLLNNRMENLEEVQGIGKLLCVNLDSNILTTTSSVQNPDLWVPDIRTKTGRRTSISCADLLAQDLEDVLKADQRMWAESKEKEQKVDPEPKGMFFNSNRSISTSNRSDMSDDFAFEDGSNQIELDCCENEKAEEAVRVAFTTFFLFLFGDMGMFLSETKSGSLWLDRKKFLRCKIVQGIAENSSLFAVMAVFSRSLLFQGFARSRVRDLELPEVEKRTATQKSLFSMCESFIRINEVDCSVSNIRNIVQKHSLLCPQRDIANSSKNIRDKALSLTSHNNTEGSALTSLASLIDSADEVNGSLGHVMGIIWIRMKENRPQLWRHPLLALYILRNLLLHGPMAVIAEANDGIAQIRELRLYNYNKNSENLNEIRSASSEIYNFLIDRASLFAERKQLACKRLKLNINTSEPRWVDYLLRRLPCTAPFDDMHALVCPKGMQPSKPIYQYKDSLNNDDNSVTSATSNTYPTTKASTHASEKSHDEMDRLNEINSKLNRVSPESSIAENSYEDDNRANKNRTGNKNDPAKEAKMLELVHMFNSTLDDEKKSTTDDGSSINSFGSKNPAN